MASSVQSYVNFQSIGSSCHLTRYKDGSFLSVWTIFDQTGAAYVYGKAFKADGTVLRNTFLIDAAAASASATYTDVTATPLSDGRTVVAWVKSSNTGKSVVGKILDSGLVPSGEILQLSIGVDAVEEPQLHALNGGFAVIYRGSYVDEGQPFTGTIGHTLGEEGGTWDTQHHVPLHDLPNDSSSSTIVLGNGTYVTAVAGGTAGQTVIQGYTRQAEGEWAPFSIDTVPGISGGINPTLSALGSDKFVVAWEDVEGANHFLHAQMFDSAGSATGASIRFAKPNGTLEGTPVIKQLAGGGFAIAFTVDVGGDDENIYTAAVDANGTIIASTMYVGTSTAGDQWDPSLVALTGNSYAVSWMSDTSSGPQFFVEVIGTSGNGSTGGTGGTGDPIPIPTTWFGTNGNDIYSGKDSPETLKGFGGNDFIDGGEGHDKLWGGLGNDTLKGGNGVDIFVFDTKPNKSTNKDKILDFSTVSDRIWLDNKVFTKLGKKGSEISPVKLSKSFFASEKAKDKNDYVIYSKSKGVLSYDADGSGSKYKPVEIATVKKGLKLTYDDFFVI